MQMTEGNERGLPSLLWMQCALVLAGVATVLLGPNLPFLAERWHLDDSQSGLLLLAQFFGAFLGGVTVSARPGRELIAGIVAAIAGLTTFAEATGIRFACIGIAVMGFGIGRLITSTNLVAAWQFPADRRSVLSKLSFSWGIGAMLSPVLSAFLTPRFDLRSILIGFAALFVILLVALLARSTRLTYQARYRSNSQQDFVGLRPATLIVFATAFALYGGLECSLSGWMTTFALRFGSLRIATSEFTSFLLLGGITAGRLLAAYLPESRSDRVILRVTLSSSIVCACVLALAQTPLMMSVCATLLGFSLAAVFPTLFSLLIAQAPLPRQAGFVNALAGLGGAIFPWLVGVLSARTGSLKLALIIPLIAAITLLWMTFARE